MHKIEAFLRPASLDDVQSALAGIGIAGMSVLEVRGYGRQRGHREIYRGAEYTIDFIPKLKLEIVVKDDDVEPALEAIMKAAKTGEVGDGKVFVNPVSQAVRIRTGEQGDEAL